MPANDKELIALETCFWQSMVDQKADAAVGLLNEPAVMVSAHGAMQFDHAAYRKMADQGTQVVTAFEFSDMKVMYPNSSTAILTYGVKQTMQPRVGGKSVVQDMNDSSAWVKAGSVWKCVMHTESPAQKKMAPA